MYTWSEVAARTYAATRASKDNVVGDNIRNTTSNVFLWQLHHHNNNSNRRSSTTKACQPTRPTPIALSTTRPPPQPRTQAPTHSHTRPTELSCAYLREGRTPKTSCRRGLPAQRSQPCTTVCAISRRASPCSLASLASPPHTHSLASPPHAPLPAWHRLPMLPCQPGLPSPFPQRPTNIACAR